MFRLSLCVAFLIVVYTALGQDQKVLSQNQSLMIELGHTQKQSHRLAIHINKLRRKRSKLSELQFIECIFDKTQTRFFRRYSQYAQYGEIFESRTYNCLTGTIVYAFVLQTLGYDTELYETRYHSFLVVKTDDPILIESTDRENGVVIGEDKINDRIQSYLKKEINTPVDPRVISLDEYIPIQAVTFQELIGLHYLNRAVVNINNNKYEKAINDLSEARRLYPRSRRISDLLTIAASQCDAIPITGTAITTDDQNPN